MTPTEHRAIGVDDALFGEALDHAPGDQVLAILSGWMSWRVTALNASMKAVMENWPRASASGR